MEQKNISKIQFETIRKKLGEKNQKWYFSIIDIVEITTKSSDARNYWKVLKNRLKTKQNQLVTACNQLKLEASDGKFYLTDVGDMYTIIEILKIISPNKILPFRAYALGLSIPREEKITPAGKTKIGNEISFRNKNHSYPQVTYNLAKLLNKNLQTSNSEPEQKSSKKIFKKVSKMGTI